ncbi:MAG TPA: acyl-CoA dehydrogenase domain-containing protein, partial [Gallionella sp.]|nr:acyl-CoA dehydrogenase domain-containing protein [Gallionella sp.]
RAYQQTPIGITVEGANILTRSMIIFGQGAIRSHPYVLKEIVAAREPNRKLALHQFDEALFGHISFALSNAARSFVFALFNGRGIPAPIAALDKTDRYYKQLTRFSAAFALSADMAMAVLGGSLKRREKISARLGDVLSMLYLCSATLKRFEDDGRPAEDLPLLHWAMQDALYKTQQAFDGVIRNFPNALARWLLSALIFPLGMRLSPPADHLGHEIAALLMQPGAARDRLTAGMYLPDDEQDAVGALEAALASTLLCEPLQAGLEKAHKAGQLKALEELPRIAEAREQGIITAEQALQLERDYTLRRKVIMVDDFAPEELRAGQR